MKKTLLSLGAVAMAAGAMASDLPVATVIPASYEDVTPAYYKFYNGQADLDKMIRNDVELPAAFNLGNNNWLTNNTEAGENYFTNQQIANGNFLFGAWVMNNHAKDEYKDAISLYDFGGNIGSALVINYQNSELNEAIKSALGLTEAPSLPTFEKTAGGNINFFATLDFNAMNDYFLLANPNLDASMLPNIPEEVEVNPIRIHVRLILNAYNNDASQEGDAFSFTYFQNEAGNVFGVSELADGSYVALEQFSDNGEWNPYGWLVRDYEFDYTGIAGAQKFQATSIADWYNNGATLIRSIEVYVVPEGETQLPNLEGKNFSANHDSWWDAKTGSIDRTEGGEEGGDDEGEGTDGVAGIGSDNVQKVEFFNLQGQKVANPENGIFIRKQGNTVSKVVVR